MTEPARILTVCTGNVCRSPYLERRLQHELDRAWGSGAVEVRSAGTGALVDSAMHPNSFELLAGQGIDGAEFRARQATRDIVAEQQLVVVAAREHRTAIAQLHPRALSRTHTLLDLAQLASLVGDEELPAQRTDARAWLDAVVPLLASKRGMQPPLEPQAAAVVDPIGQGPDVFGRMQQQIEQALPQVLRVLGA